ncbi:MAG: amidohydrolase [Kiritimatiellae bacterium]|nr:amidohydrolase [Kiritimatiellia bacterium]
MVLKNGVVFKGEEFVECPVAVKDGVIAGFDAAACEDAGGEEIDANGCLVLPGLVNCHGHTAMTLVRGLGAGLPLQRWLEEAIFPVEAKMTPEDIAAGMTWGAMEMLAGGTTTVADMYDFPDAGAAALSNAGMRGNLCRVGLAFSEDQELPPNRLKECVDFVVAHSDGNILGDFCLHSEYLTNEKFCRELVKANSVFRRPVHVHVSETEKEHRDSIQRHGKTPMRYLCDLGVFDHGGYAAHCVYATDDDLRLMREKGVTLVHNPTSNMKLGSGFAPVAKALAAGVNVALGTDGCASNDNLDMFEEMHLASLVAKGIARDPAALPALDVIKMATANGAKALGRGNIGKIETGMLADFAIVDLGRPHLRPVLDFAGLVVNSMHASDVIMTIVGGEILYNRGVFPSIDPWKAKEDFDSSVRRLHSR